MDRLEETNTAKAFLQCKASTTVATCQMYRLNCVETARDNEALEASKRCHVVERKRACRVETGDLLTPTCKTGRNLRHAAIPER
jgi:hypothetical protein